MDLMDGRLSGTAQILQYFLYVDPVSSGFPLLVCAHRDASPVLGDAIHNIVLIGAPSGSRCRFRCGCGCFLCVSPGRAHRRLVQSAVEGNFNMLRVWGQGIWEPRAFHDACDEMGVLLLSDSQIEPMYVVFLSTSILASLLLSFILTWFLPGSLSHFARTVMHHLS